MSKAQALLNASMTIQEFCACEKLSRWSYYKMKDGGHGPDEIRIPGTELVRITHAARERWHRRMAGFAKSKAAKLESARRDAQRRAAGRSSAAKRKVA